MNKTQRFRGRIRFLAALLIPVVYLNLPGRIGPRLWFTVLLFMLTLAFIFIPEEWVKCLFKFCGMPDNSFEKDLRNRWEKVCYGVIYGSLGICVIGLCLYKPDWLPLRWIPDDVLIKYVTLGRRLTWCFAWSIAGLSIAAISDARRKREGVRSPFPPYLYFYPAFLIVNSLMIFGFLSLITEKGEVYYSLAAFFSLNLGFWIDSINFNNFLEKFFESVGKVFSK